ncbi:carbohydrate ABC transporter permease [Muricomes sp. OA1]|nr:MULTISPECIES: carbohydrate ABC transporter permease [Clostridia]MCH1971266.1 carbohydrate ABC transporter permease [Muricomes sp. OA1]GKH34563.1 sugar ABC transporter permease [Faecalicatena contorta]
MRMKKKLSAILTNVIAWAISAVCMIPLLLILFNSLKNSNAASDMNLKLPGSIEWSNFLNVIEKGKLGASSFANSILYSVCSVAVCVLLAAMAAYVLSRNGSKFYRVIYMYLVLGITMPINYVALTKVMMFLHINNTRLGIILLYAAMQLPFSVFLIHGFVARIPRELDEAAVIDGCGSTRLFISIILPLLKPALATVIVLTFLNTWNEFVSPLYFLSSSDKWPMTLSIYNFFGMYFKEWNLVCADILLTSLPVILVYLAGQKYIVSGMIAGAVKG